MPIELTPEQAEAVAKLARELGGTPVSLHQIAGGSDVYLAEASEPESYLIAADGQVAPMSHD